MRCPWPHMDTRKVLGGGVTIRAEATAAATVGGAGEGRGSARAATARRGRNLASVGGHVVAAVQASSFSSRVRQFAPVYRHTPAKYSRQIHPLVLIFHQETPAIDAFPPKHGDVTFSITIHLMRALSDVEINSACRVTPRECRPSPARLCPSPAAPPELGSFRPSSPPPAQ